MSPRREAGGPPLQEPAELLPPCSSCGEEGPPCGKGASLRGGMRSLILSSPLASSKLVILWCGEKPASALRRDVLPPERAPNGRVPVGVSPLS